MLGILKYLYSLVNVNLNLAGRGCWPAGSSPRGMLVAEETVARTAARMENFMVLVGWLVSGVDREVID